MKDFLKKITGIEAYEKNKEAKSIKKKSEAKLKLFEEEDKKQREKLNSELSEFGTYRLSVMKNTIGVFLRYVDIMNKKVKDKDYECLADIDIQSDTYISEIKSLHMSATDILKTTVTSASAGAIALSGVPTAITTGVSALASASTGTAISSLSGAAATKATLAWLGGGSLAAGGGGVAAGTALLSTITWTATGGLALVAAGTIASKIYDKKLTQTKEFEKEVDIHCAQLESNWEMMGMVSRRVEELKYTTQELEKRIISELQMLEPLISDFDSSHSYHIRVFQTLGLLVKAMGENVQVSLLTDNGMLTNESKVIIEKTNKILNKSLK